MQGPVWGTLNGHRLSAVAQISGLATPPGPLTLVCPFLSQGRPSSDKTLVAVYASRNLSA